MTITSKNKIYIKMSLWDKLPYELKHHVITFAPEHREQFDYTLREILRLNHKKLYDSVMNTLLYEWYDDDGYLEICANEYCERPIQKGNEIWHTVLFGEEYAFCCDYCVSLGSWGIVYDYRKSRRRAAAH